MYIYILVHIFTEMKDIIRYAKAFLIFLDICSIYISKHVLYFSYSPNYTRVLGSAVLYIEQLILVR